MDDIACERGCMAAALVAERSTQVNASRGDDGMRIIFECTILDEEIAWDPDMHSWDGPVEEVLARLANDAIHKSEELKPGDEPYPGQMLHNSLNNECGLGDGQKQSPFQCAHCKRQICSCFWADDLYSGPVCCNCWVKT